MKRPAARQVYNACLGETLKRREALLHSQAYHTVKTMAAGKARAAAFAQAQRAVGFEEYALHDYAAQFGHTCVWHRNRVFSAGRVRDSPYKNVSSRGESLTRLVFTII